MVFRQRAWYGLHNLSGYYEDSYLCYNYPHMYEGQTIQGIIGGFLAITGLLLAIISSGIWFRRVKIRIGFLGIGLALSGLGLFILITNFPQYAIGFSVLATLALAFAAFLTIKEANEREERHRKQEIEKEERDRDERLLNEIIKWAEDIDIASLTPDISFIDGNSRDVQLLRAERDANTLMRYGISRSKATSILTIVEERFKGALLKYLNKVLNELIEFMYIKQMMLSKASPNENNFPKRTVNKMTKEIAKGDKSFDQLFEDHAKNLAESVRELLKKANKTKAGLLR